MGRGALREGPCRRRHGSDETIAFAMWCHRGRCLCWRCCNHSPDLALCSTHPLSSMPTRDEGTLVVRLVFGSNPRNLKDRGRVSRGKDQRAGRARQLSARIWDHGNPPEVTGSRYHRGDRGVTHGTSKRNAISRKHAIRSLGQYLDVEISRTRHRHPAREWQGYRNLPGPWANNKTYRAG